MKLPSLINVPTPTSVEIYDFKGYNATSTVSNGEASDTLNISSDELPIITQRKSRGDNLVSALVNPKAIHSVGNKYCYIADGKFYYDGVEKGAITSANPQIISMGDYILIFPDAVYYKIKDDVFRSLKYEVTIAGDVTVSWEYSYYINGWAFGHIGDSVSFSAVTGLKDFLAVDDTVIFNSTSAGGLFIGMKDKECQCTGVSNTSIGVSANTFKISEEANTAEDAPDDEKGGVHPVPVTFTNLTIKKKLPELDFVCESNNRLWGCKGSTIYASKLGNPLIWYCYSGLLTDSYTLDVGTTGDFTGCISTPNYVIFLKENYIHKIYGEKPSSYQLTTVNAIGLSADSPYSLTNYNDTIFFKSKNEIMTFDGNNPVKISEKLGMETYTNAVGCTDGKKYYVCMKDSYNVFQLFVYDIDNRLWIKEESLNITDFMLHQNSIVALDSAGNIFNMVGDTVPDDLEWSVTFGETNENIHEKKRYGKFLIHCELEKKSTLEVQINCDRTGWIDMFKDIADGRRSVIIPLVPTRCETISIKLSGKGKCKIHSITREVYKGSAN